MVAECVHLRRGALCGNVRNVCEYLATEGVNEFARGFHRVRELVPAEREDDKTHRRIRTPPRSAPNVARGTTDAQRRVVECVLRIRVPSLDGAIDYDR